MVDDALFSSKSTEHGTPDDLWAHLSGIFNFVLDAAADADNALCDNYMDEEYDALSRDWAEEVADLGGGVIYCNPPYGRGVGAWLDKAWEAAQKGVTTVMLLPARTSNGWWHEHVTAGHCIPHFIKGRVPFKGNFDKNGKPVGAPFPSVLLYFFGQKLA